MLEALSCRFGCQPDFRSPNDVNEYRRRPLIALDDGFYFFARIWAPLQEYGPDRVLGPLDYEDITGGQAELDVLVALPRWHRGPERRPT